VLRFITKLEDTGCHKVQFPCGHLAMRVMFCVLGIQEARNRNYKTELRNKRHGAECSLLFGAYLIIQFPVSKRPDSSALSS
jgi:hypothetical protein